MAERENLCLGHQNRVKEVPNKKFEHDLGSIPPPGLKAARCENQNFEIFEVEGPIFDIGGVRGSVTISEDICKIERIF